MAMELTAQTMGSLPRLRGRVGEGALFPIADELGIR